MAKKKAAPAKKKPAPAPAKKKPAAPAKKKPAAPAKKKAAAPAKTKPAAPAKKKAAAPAKKKPAAPVKKAAPAKPRASTAPPKPRARTAPPDPREQLLTDSFAAREQTWSAWGDVDSDVISHLINPTFAGGPRWPALRQAFRVVRRGGDTLVASDGLSDPFDEDTGPPDRNGFGLEVFAVTPERLDPVAPSWLFDLVWNGAQLAAGRGDLLTLLDELGPISTELYDVRVPDTHADRFLNEAGRVGALIGVEDSDLPSRVDGPLSPIRLVSIVLLTRAELDYVLEHGDDGRAELSRRLAGLAAPLRSSLHRPSVV